MAIRLESIHVSGVTVDLASAYQGLATMGVPTLLRQKCAKRRSAILLIRKAALEAWDNQNSLDSESHLANTTQSTDNRLNLLSSDIIFDAGIIQTLLALFSQLLTGNNGGPNWTDIQQESSTSQSYWGYLKAELENLSTIDYGSSNLGHEGNLIIGGAYKVRRLAATYFNRVTTPNNLTASQRNQDLHQ